MRIPALPQTKEIKLKRRVSLVKIVRHMVAKRTVKKRPFVRIPPRN